MLEPTYGIVSGWRIWPITTGRKGDLLLRGLVLSKPWVPRRANKASCPSCKSCPGFDHRCGFNVYSKVAPHRLRLEVGMASLLGHGLLVVGEAQLWGKVVEHEEGFRGQLAYPTKLFGCVESRGFRALHSLANASSENMSSIWKIARLYRIPVEFELPSYFGGE